jgi:hypothetical protein
LYTLPDDVLRALAAFVPPSALIAFAQCSRRLAELLGGQLARRLDGFFAATRQLTESEMMQAYNTTSSSRKYPSPVRCGCRR